MSNIAYQLNPDGTRKKIHISSVNRENSIDVTYICCGVVKGCPCPAELIPVFKNGRADHFRATSVKHARGCPHDNSRAAIIISHLDMMGSKTTIDSLFSALAIDDADNPTTGQKNPRLKPGEADCDTENIESQNRSIERKARNPQNLLELVLLLSRLSKNDTYAGCKVDHLIIDRENIMDARKNKAMPKQPVVVVCSKISVDRIRKRVPNISKSNQVVLEDGFAFDDRCRDGLLFAFNATEKARKKIFSAKKEAYIVVFATWTPNPDKPNVYIANATVQSKLVAVVPKNLLDN